MIFDQNKFSQILKLYFSGSSKDVGIGVFLAQKAPHPLVWDPTNAFIIVAVVKTLNAWALKGRLISSSRVFLQCTIHLTLRAATNAMQKSVSQGGHII